MVKHTANHEHFCVPKKKNKNYNIACIGLNSLNNNSLSNKMLYAPLLVLTQYFDSQCVYGIQIKKKNPHIFLHLSGLPIWLVLPGKVTAHPSSGFGHVTFIK